MASEKGSPVELYIYDLTHGMAAILAPAIIGQQLEGVWHTAVVVHGREYFYGGGGITSCPPGSTQLGAPHQVLHLGDTFVPFQVFTDYLHGLATSTYTGESYRLFEHNCNHFSDEVAQFLCGGHCPKHILSQPEVVSPALRLALQAFMDQLTPGNHQTAVSGRPGPRPDSPDYLTLNHQIEEARAQSQQLEQRRSTLAEKLARKERRREKKRRKQLGTDDHDMAEAEAVMAESSRAGLEPGLGEAARAVAAADAEERRAEEQRKRERDPPIVYRDIDATQEYEAFVKSLSDVELSAEETQSLEELQLYLVQGEGSWALGDNFLTFIGRILSDGSVGGTTRTCLLRCLAAGALRDDVSLLLHQDRRDHALVNYAHSVDSRPPTEQRALALFMCNLFENISSSEWLLYISEWEYNGQPMSNIRATTKVAVQTALSEDAEVREVGTALLYNVASKEVKTVVFDEVCVELAMALLQLLSVAPGEELLYRCVKALARLVHSSQDVPQLVAVVGPNPAAFRGTSPRVDEQIDLIMVKVK